VIAKLPDTFLGALIGAGYRKSIRRLEIRIGRDNSQLEAGKKEADKGARGP